MPRIEADGTPLATATPAPAGPATAFIHASAVVLDGAAAPSPEPAALHRWSISPSWAITSSMCCDNGTGAQLKAHAPVGAATHARGAEVSVLLPSDKLIVVPRESLHADELRMHRFRQLEEPRATVCARVGRPRRWSCRSGGAADLRPGQKLPHRGSARLHHGVSLGTLDGTGEDHSADA